MISEKFLCKNGKELKITTIGPKEAEQFLKFMKQVSGETHFMSRYEDEVDLSKEGIAAERERQKILFEDERQTMISIFDDNRIIGNIAIRTQGKSRKTDHRCAMGLGILKEYHGYGLGTLLMERGLAFAKEVGYQCVELGVLADNVAARSLYKKMGFEESGCLPGAFHLDDGRWIDEISMYKKI